MLWTARGFCHNAIYLAEYCAKPLQPYACIGAVRDAPDESQLLGDVVSVGTNILLCAPHIEFQKSIHADRLGEDVSGVAGLWPFHGNGALESHDEFISG